MDLTVTIITHNEEKNLRSCLESLPEGVEIVIVDSGSTDDTIKIARAYTNQIFHEPFIDFASQKNHALSHATRRWILSIDADETLDADLCSALKDVLDRGAESITGYRVRRYLEFLGRKLKFGKTSDRPLRLFRREYGTFVGKIHEKVQLKEGQVQALHLGSLCHKSYDDLEDYFARFNRYTSLIATNHSGNEKKFSIMGHVLRPWVEFINRYFIRLGFLDGYPGYVYALNSSLYAFIKYAKLLEMNQTLAESTKK